MRKFLFWIGVMMVGLVLFGACKSGKQQQSVAGDGTVRPLPEEKDSAEMKSMSSPYSYNPEQTEVTFSEHGDTLFRFPRIEKGGDYVIPSTVRMIYDRAFLGCRNLKSVVIPSSVREIEMAAFSGCLELERVYLNAELESIPFRFLEGCPKLKEIHLNQTVPPVIEEDEEDESVNLQMSLGYSKTLTVYVPKEAVQTYKRAYGWRLLKIVGEH